MEFLSSVNSLGTIPLLILIIVIFILLFREIKGENRRLSKAFDDHKAALDKVFGDYKEDVDRQIKSQNLIIEKMEARLRTVETDYAEKTYVQEAMSGWRTEIRRIDDKLDRVLINDAKKGG